MNLMSKILMNLLVLEKYYREKVRRSNFDKLHLGNHQFVERNSYIRLLQLLLFVLGHFVFRLCIAI